MVRFRRPIRKLPCGNQARRIPYTNNAQVRILWPNVGSLRSVRSGHQHCQQTRIPTGVLSLGRHHGGVSAHIACTTDLSLTGRAKLCTGRHSGLAFEELIRRHREIAVNAERQFDIAAGIGWSGERGTWCQ